MLTVQMARRAASTGQSKTSGTVIMTAALELSTNQITHFYSPAKNTVEMIRLLDLLVEQCAGHRTLYFSWDAASWHASKELAQHVSDLNASPPSGERCGPRVEVQKSSLVEREP